jgi:anti-anti-sigma factor
MQKCTYMDSCAIGWLMACHKGFRDNGGKMVLHSVQPRVKQLMDLLRIGNVIAVASDESAAKSLVTQGGAK